jgi:hypothetical protein
MMGWNATSLVVLEWNEMEWPRVALSGRVESNRISQQLGSHNGPPHARTARYRLLASIAGV